MNLQTIVVALIGGGVVGFVQFLISRHDKQNDRFDEIMKVVTEIDRKNDERYANTMRVRILAFADEMADRKDHTEDEWKQVITDCDEYENFVKHCEENKIEFKNNIATITIEYLKDEYAERLKKHDFRKVSYEPKRTSKN